MKTSPPAEKNKDVNTQLNAGCQEFGLMEEWAEVCNQEESKARKS